MTDAPDIAAVRLAIDNAALVPGAPEDDGGGDRRHGGGDVRLPDDCPVTPLGSHGTVRYYLDAMQQLIELPLRDHSQNLIKGLFGIRTDLLPKHWPRFNKEGEVTGWRPELAGEALMKAAAAKGVIDLFDRVRGAGAWLGDDGELILHCGDGVLCNTSWHACGLVGDYVYPAASPKPRPAQTYAAGGSKGPASDLLALLRTWNWRRPEVDPFLLLGWIGAAMLGGALDWRPAMWLTGDKATGKSTLQEVLRLVFDKGGLFSLADASQAGITQYVGHSSLPVAIDELEPSDDNRRAQAIINLARLAASGGQMARGGSDHVGRQFTIRFCILFSSILVPPLAPQDRSRLAILELDPLGSTKAPTLSRPKLRALGAALRRRLVDQWQRFPTVLDDYRIALAEAGHSGRGADQYGTLLAMQELLLHDGEHVPADALVEWGEKLQAATIAERGDDLADHERCLNHILTSIVDPYRGGSRRTIAQWIGDAMAGAEDQPKTANAVLETYGIKVVLEPTGDALERVGWLYVSNTHQGLAELFKATHWAGGSGKSAVYVQALRRVSFAVAGGDTARFGLVATRYTKVPLAHALPDLAKP